MLLLRPLVLPSQPIWLHPKLKLIHTAGAGGRPNPSSWEQGDTGPNTTSPVGFGYAARTAAGKLRSPSQALPSMASIPLLWLGEGNTEMREMGGGSLLLAPLPQA